MPKLKYDESLPERAGEYAAGGMNNAEIAAKLDISEDTFYTYQRQFPEFAAAVETGRLAVSADKIESSLMDMALGRCFTTTVKHSVSGRETKTIRQLVPNLKMLIRWLERNRQYADNGDGDIRTSEPVKVNIAVNSKYDESFLEDVERHAAEGYTDLQIARRLGIALSSFYNYKKQFPDFAAALDSGRRECYGRLRCQLLALALGKCTVRTETCRDGDFRKSTERQLPPNLEAIKYWLTGGCPSGKTASAQEHSKVSESGGCPSDYAGRLAGGCPSDYAGRMGAGGCPSDYAGRMGKGTASAQGHCKVSECQSDKSSQSDKHSAQGHCKVSECQSDKSTQSDKHSAQGHSKISESGGCPSDYAGRMGKSSAVSSQSHDRRFAKMSRKERQRLLKNRQGK